MELIKIEQLLEKYFDGLTTLAEEKELSAYFSSANVAPHLEQYRDMFGYFKAARLETPQHELKALPKNRTINITAWLSVAASVVVLLGVGSYFMLQDRQPENLGTFDNPEVAYRETQKALALLSGHINQGAQSVRYVEVYECAKDKSLLLQ